MQDNTASADAKSRIEKGTKMTKGTKEKPEQSFNSVP